MKLVLCISIERTYRLELKTQFRMVRNVIVRTMGAAKLGLQRKLFRNRHIPFRVSATFS